MKTICQVAIAFSTFVLFSVNHAPVLALRLGFKISGDFSSEQTLVPPDFSDLSGGFFKGKFFYDPDTPDLNPGSSANGKYEIAEYSIDFFDDNGTFVNNITSPPDGFLLAESAISLSRISDNNWRYNLNFRDSLNLSENASGQRVPVAFSLDWKIKAVDDSLPSISPDKLGEFLPGVVFPPPALVTGSSLTQFDTRKGVAVTSASAKLNSITLEATKDSTIYEPLQDEDFILANGQGERFFVGANSEDRTRRGLIAFENLEDVPKYIPSETEIDSVELKLQKLTSRISDVEIELHKITQDWSEGTSIARGRGTLADNGDTTWLHSEFPNSFWINEGGDFSLVDSSSGSQSVSSSDEVYSWSSDQMKADVQQWVEDPSNNFGWLLKAQDESMSGLGFGSKDGDDSSSPLLTINLVKTPEPSSLLSFLALGTLGVGYTLKRKLKNIKSLH